MGNFLEMEDPDWHIHIVLNLTGTANAIRAFAPARVQRGAGRIIVINANNTPIISVPVREQQGR